MKQLEIVLSKRNSRKLTITPTRISLKLPETTSSDDVEVLKEFSLEINSELKAEQAWRGTFRELKHNNQLVVTLYSGCRNKSKYFKLEK